MSSWGESEAIAAREYAAAYRVSGKRDLVDAVASAIERSSARLLSITGHVRAPFHLGVALPGGGTLGAMVYAFRGTTEPIGGRDHEERRFQLRLGGERSWTEREHPVGWDPAGVEATLMLGVHLHDDGSPDLFVGVDPSLYDPMPMGISIEYGVEDLEEARQTGWHVWERETRVGRRRDARYTSLETVVAFTPERFVDWMRFETEAQSLGLDHALRYGLAERAAAASGGRPHDLEAAFGLSSAEILDVIGSRQRLAVAVRGGIAEKHLDRWLRRDRTIRSVVAIDEDDRPDFEVQMADRPTVALIECKNVSPKTLADGTMRVEVQKTRGRVPERLYPVGHFDIVAACLWSVTKAWEFRFAPASNLDRHPDHPDRLASTHRIDGRWQATVAEALDHA